MQLRVLVEADGRWHFGAHDVTPPQMASFAEFYVTLLRELVWNGRMPVVRVEEEANAAQPTA